MLEFSLEQFVRFFVLEVVRTSVRTDRSWKTDFFTTAGNPAPRHKKSAPSLGISSQSPLDQPVYSIEDVFAVCLLHSIRFWKKKPHNIDG